VIPPHPTPGQPGMGCPRAGATPRAAAGRLLAEMDARQVALVYARYLPGRWAELRRGYRTATDAAGVVAERRGLYRALVDDDALPLLPEEELIERLMEEDDDDDEPPIGPDGRLSPGAVWWTRVVPVRNDLVYYGCEPPPSWAETVLAGLYATWGDYSCSRDADWSAPAPADGWDPTGAGARLLARGYAIRRAGHRPDESLARVEAVWPARAVARPARRVALHGRGHGLGLSRPGRRLGGDGVRRPALGLACVGGYLPGVGPGPRVPDSFPRGAPRAHRSVGGRGGGAPRRGRARVR